MRLRFDNDAHSTKCSHDTIRLRHDLTALRPPCDVHSLAFTYLSLSSGRGKLYYTILCFKKGATFIFAIPGNFGKFRPILIFFHCCILRPTTEKGGIVTTTSPHYLPKLECATVQLYKKVRKLNMAQ